MLLQLRLKDEEAKMLGFANYAALSLAPKMAKTVSEVDQFLEDFAKRAKSHGQKDWEDLQQFAKDNLNIEKLEPWDMAYASEKLKQARYSFSENELKQYFPLPKVLDGLFSIIQTLFGVKILEDEHKELILEAAKKAFYYSTPEFTRDNYGFSDVEVQKLKRLYDYAISEDDFNVKTNRKDFISFVDEHDKRRGTDFLKTFPQLENLYNNVKNNRR
jgi:hypothetical protein